MVRAKFVVKEISRAKYSAASKETQVIKLSPVIDGSEENKKFYAFTPIGSIELATLNPEAGNQFELGKEYYVDFTPAAAA